MKRPIRRDHRDRQKLLMIVEALRPELRADAAAWSDYKLGRGVMDIVGASPDHVTRNGAKVRNRSDDFVVAFALKAAERSAGMPRRDEAPSKIVPSPARVAMVKRNQDAWRETPPAPADATTPMPADDEIAKILDTGSIDDLRNLVTKLTAPREDAQSPRQIAIERAQNAWRKPIT